MLSTDIIEGIARVVDDSESGILERLARERSRQEPDITSRLADRIELAAAQIGGVTITLTVVDGIGPGSAERRLGADVVGVLRVALGDLRLTKGFLVQAKRSGSDGLRFAKGSRSHWLERGDLDFGPSGTVRVGRPSAHLNEQCENMLKRSPDSFVWVYDEAQIAVVSALAVRASFGRRSRRPQLSLGTKCLADFFVHLADCFIGDPSLVAVDAPTIAALAASERSGMGLLMRVSDDDQV